MADCCVKCELRVIRAKNIEKTLKGPIFIRCYISAGNNTKIQLNTKEVISPNDHDHLVWDETFSLECNGAENVTHSLKEENIVFEMRRRKIVGSQVVGQAEVTWRSVLDATNMEICRWVKMSSNSSEKVEDEECRINPVELEVGIKLESSRTLMSRKEMRRRRREERVKKNRDACGCGCGCSSSSSNGECGCCCCCCCCCVEDDLLLSAEAFDAF